MQEGVWIQEICADIWSKHLRLKWRPEVAHTLARKYSEDEGCGTEHDGLGQSDHGLVHEVHQLSRDKVHLPHLQPVAPRDVTHYLLHYLRTFVSVTTFTTEINYVTIIKSSLIGGSDP